MFHAFFQYTSIFFCLVLTQSESLLSCIHEATLRSCVCSEKPWFADRRHQTSSTQPAQQQVGTAETIKLTSLLHTNQPCPHLFTSLHTLGCRGAPLMDKLSSFSLLFLLFGWKCVTPVAGHHTSISQNKFFHMRKLGLLPSPFGSIFHFPLLLCNSLLFLSVTIWLFVCLGFYSCFICVHRRLREFSFYFVRQSKDETLKYLVGSFFFGLCCFWL